MEEKKYMKIRSISKKMLVGVFAVLISATLIASAGLLTYYGTIETRADVEQSVVLWDGSEWVNYNTPVSNNFDTTGGNCECYSHSIKNRASVEAPINIDTSINAYGKGPDGVDVSYIMKYDAGHTFPVDYEYDHLIENEGSAHIQYALDNYVSAGDVVFVKGGTYDGFTVNTDDVTVASSGTTVDGIKIKADGVTIDGFEVTGAYDNGIWLMQDIEGATIRNNYIHDTEDKINYEDSSTGIYLESGAMTDTVIEYNTIEYNFAGIGGTEDFTGEINYNVIKNNDEGIGVGDAGFSTYGNIFENNVADFRIYYDSLGWVDGKPNYYGCDGPIIDKLGHTGSDVSADYGYLGDSFTLEPGQQIDFVIKYCFDVAIDPGQYDITTTFSPGTD